jgi:hypothetical protein
VWIRAVRPGDAHRRALLADTTSSPPISGAAGLGAIDDLGFIGLDDGHPDADPAVICGCKAARNRPPRGVSRA